MAQQAGLETALCRSVWLHSELMFLLQELRAETRGVPTPQQVLQKRWLLLFAIYQGMKVSQNHPESCEIRGWLGMALGATWGSVLPPGCSSPSECPRGLCTQFHQGTRLLPLAWAQPSGSMTSTSWPSQEGQALEP